MALIPIVFNEANGRIERGPGSGTGGNSLSYKGSSIVIDDDANIIINGANGGNIIINGQTGNVDVSPKAGASLVLSAFGGLISLDMDNAGTISITTRDINSHVAIDKVIALNNAMVPQGQSSPIADATDNPSAITQLNALLSYLRLRGDVHS